MMLFSCVAITAFSELASMAWLPLNVMLDTCTVPVSLHADPHTDATPRTQRARRIAENLFQKNLCARSALSVTSAFSRVRGSGRMGGLFVRGTPGFWRGLSVLRS